MLDLSEQYFERHFDKLHFSAPVKLKDSFLQEMRTIFSNRNVLGAGVSIDEGIDEVEDYNAYSKFESAYQQAEEWVPTRFGEETLLKRKSQQTHMDYAILTTLQTCGVISYETVLTYIAEEGVRVDDDNRSKVLRAFFNCLMSSKTKLSYSGVTAKSESKVEKKSTSGKQW
ncbi:MAG: hypothetical protein IJ862_00160 [Selenomonadaceae bacterium]|nr:hypothetical protein [Selenomonadaceae bacterium]